MDLFRLEYTEKQLSVACNVGSINDHDLGIFAGSFHSLFQQYTQRWAAQNQFPSIHRVISIRMLRSAIVETRPDGSAVCCACVAILLPRWRISMTNINEYKHALSACFHWLACRLRQSNRVAELCYALKRKKYKRRERCSSPTLASHRRYEKSTHQNEHSMCCILFSHVSIAIAIHTPRQVQCYRTAVLIVLNELRISRFVATERG